MKKVIVAGASGFVGKHLVSKLLNEGIHVIAIVRKSSTSIEKLPQHENLNIVLVDTNIGAYRLDEIKEDDYDVFYNLAWVGAAGPKRADYNIQLDNIRMNLDYLMEAERLGCKKFIAVGTIGEYMAELALDKNIKSENFIYAISKNFTNKLLKVLEGKTKCRTIWCTLANLYGVGDTTGNLVSYTINNLLQGKTPDFGPAEQPFDFLYITDCVEALYLLGEKETKSREFFLGSGNPKPLKDFLNQICQIVSPGTTLGIGNKPDDGTEYKYEWYNIDKLKEETGFKPNYSFEEGINLIIKNANK